MRHVLVVGAGPAGLAAAVAASDAGARVTLLDSGDGLGGQYWRHLPPQRPSRREARLHHGWPAFERLRDRVLRDDAIEVLTEAQVWAIETAEAGTAQTLTGPADDAGREACAPAAESTRTRTPMRPVGTSGREAHALAAKADTEQALIGPADAAGREARVTADAVIVASPDGSADAARRQARTLTDAVTATSPSGSSAGTGSAVNALNGSTTVQVLIGPADASGREARALTADSIVFATGAHDRTLPFPGWHLPGVFSAGAAQALAKGERIAVGRRVLVAGTGPFLLPVAQSLTAAGATVVGVYEASGLPAIAKGWLPRPWRLLRASHKGPELAGYLAHHLAHRVPYRLGRAVVEVRGDGRVEEAVIARLDADWTPVPGTERTVAADAVCVSHGFNPRLELPIAAGCRIGPDRFVLVDEAQRTSVEGVYAAGEITGIGGVDAALVEGHIAGHGAASGGPHRSLLRRRAATVDFARRIEAAHGIRPGWTSWLRDDTIVCRCEEVPYGRIRGTAAATAQDSLRSLKLTTRAGLGLCQARICGRTVEDLTGADRSGATDRRPLAAPIRLGDLAGLVTTPDGGKDTL